MSDIESIQRDVEETLLSEDFHCYDEAVKFREHCRALLSALAITREEGFNEARDKAAIIGRRIIDAISSSRISQQEMDEVVSNVKAIRALSHTPQSIQKEKQP